MNNLQYVQSPNCKLFEVGSQGRQFIEQDTLIIKKTLNQRRQLLIGSIKLQLLPETLIQFESPEKNADKCLTYYFSRGSKDFVLKIRNNPQQIHMALRASGCKRRQRPIVQKGWVDSMKGMFGINDNQTNHQNRPQQYVVLRQPTQRFTPMNCPNNTPQQQQQTQQIQSNMIRQAVGSLVTNPNVQHYLSPSIGDTPIVMIGKYILNGALNNYVNQNQNQNILR